MASLKALQHCLSYQAQLATTVADCDEVFTFAISAVVAHKDSDDLLIDHYGLPDDHNWSVSLLKSDPDALRFAISTWFHNSDTHPVDDVMNLLREFLGDNYSVNEVTIVPNCGQDLEPMYEAQWQDFLLRSQVDTYLLHLGVSD